MTTENRESFFTRLEPLFPPSVLLDIQLAYTLAKYGHRSQVRKEKDERGDPVRYFEHVRRVAIILVDEVHIPRPEMIISSLLHDGPEDTRDLTHAMVEHCWGTDVCSIVKVLSKTPPLGYLDRFNQCTDWRPYVLKGCDRLDNLRSLASGAFEFRVKQLTETREKYFPLFDRMLKLVPDEYRDRASALRDAIRQETAHQGAILSAAPVT